MPLNKQKPESDMYNWISHSFTPIRGRCPYKCKYCYAKHFTQKALHLDQKDLKLDLYKDSTPDKRNVIFVCSTIDMFHPDVPIEWIEEVLRHCNEFPDNKYLLQTKSPHRYWHFTHLFTKHYALCTTIETNRDTSSISLAPPTCRRVVQMAVLSNKGYNVSITIEPIIQFDLEIMVEWMKEIKPLWINIGADSKGHNLDEPSWDKVEALISELKKFTRVVIKNNLGRLRKSITPTES
ncbi:hypothetical protein LCGC14_0548760 [marine sediment metagenome]|uniref:Radical SAM core domain-containing protein n=1 Tax=marine sediment metagenome TaxID=412755 RepID=A0A0F9UC30_9ZZZZ